MTPNRRHMDPSTLEDIIILKFNTDLWNAELIELILQGLQEENIAQSLATPSTGGTSSPTTGGSIFQKPRVLLRESIRQKFYITTSSYFNSISIWYSY